MVSSGIISAPHRAQHSLKMGVAGKRNGGDITPVCQVQISPGPYLDPFHIAQVGLVVIRGLVAA